MTELGAAPEAPPAPASTRWRPPKLSRRVWIRTAVVAILCAGVAGYAFRDTSKRASPKPDAASVDKKISSAIDKLQAAPAPGVGVFDTIRGSIVVIQAKGVGGAGTAGDLGTGVIVNAQGEILTSLHVVQDATSIKVTFADGTESAATIASSDADHDSAVLLPDQSPGVVVKAVLGGSGRVGDETYAVGHPLGLVDSLSAGVISGLGRTFQLPNGRTLTGLIQFDAAANPGNSGGPLLNRKGQVIGIVTGLVNPSGAGAFAGIGFAVPIGAAGGAAGAPSR
jgi:S1-C subfamily serine protease